MGLAAWELSVARPNHYFVAGLGPGRVAWWALTLVLGALGVISARRVAEQARAWGLAAALLGVGWGELLGALAGWYGFGGGWLVGGLSGATALGAFSLGAALALLTGRWLRAAVALGLAATLTHPLVALVAWLSVGLGASLLLTLGTLRAPLLLAALLAVLAVQSLQVLGWLGAAVSQRARRWVRWGSGLTLVSAVALFALSLRWLPRWEHELHPNDVVWASIDDDRRIVVTSGQDTLELFVDGRWRGSSAAEARYFDALTAQLPAQARRVLLLGGGTGRAEARLLAHEGVTELVSVCPEPGLFELVTRSAWGRAQGLDRLRRDPRLTLLEDEALPWLLSEPAQPRWDAIVVDLPEPTVARHGMHYTRFFYRQLALRLAEGGVLTQATFSAFRSPEMVANVRATAEAAGLVTRVVRAAVPTAGEQSFLVAARRADWLPQPLQALDHVPLDSQASAVSRPSTLSSQRVVELLTEALERERR